MPYIGQRPATGEANSFKILDEISSYTLTFDGSSAGVVSVANDTITEREHRFVTGQRVTYNDGGGTAITGLSDGVYYIIVEDRNTFKLATNANNAASGTAIDLTGLGVGASHTLNVAFDGVNTKFKATINNGTKAGISQSGQIMLSINGVLQEPHDNTTTPSTGYATDHTSTIIFSAAPAANDQFFGRLIASNFATFDISDNTVDNFTGDGSTTDFTLSKTPPNNESLLVTIDGVVQYPDDTSAVRAYTVSENILSFVSAPGLAVEIQVRHIGFAGASTGGISGFYGRTGNAVLKSTDNIVFNDATASGTVQAANVTVTGDLTVNGTTTTLDTDLIGVDKLEVAANNTTVAAAITQTGSGDILNLYDGSSSVFRVLDGGNVKIGPAGNPTFGVGGGLEVERAGAATIRIEDTGSSSSFEIQNTGGVIKQRLYNNQPWTIEYGSGEKLRITSAGLVGIGTDNPSNLLHVYGQSRFEDYLLGNSTHNKLYILDDVAITATKKLYFDTGSNTYIDEVSADTLRFATAGTERLRLDGNGRLTISGQGLKLNPIVSSLYSLDGSLSYYGTTNAVYLNGAGANGWLRLNASGVENNQNAINIFGGSAGAHIDMRTNNVERLRITSAGNVGINVTSPEDPLHVKNTSDAATSIRIQTGTSSTNNGDEYSSIIFDGNSYVGAKIASHRDDGTWNDRGDLRFYSGYGNNVFTERLRITNTGDMGLGTASPRSITNFGSFAINGTAGSFTDYFLNGTRTGTTAVDSNGFTSEAVGSSTPFRVITNGTEKLRIRAEGPHLLIGTGGDATYNEITESSSNAGLVIGSSSMANGGIVIRNSTSGTGRIYFADNSGSDPGRQRGSINYYHAGDYMNFATAGSERLRIAKTTATVSSTGTGANGTGCVGINETVPANYALSLTVLAPYGLEDPRPNVYFKRSHGIGGGSSTDETNLYCDGTGGSYNSAGTVYSIKSYAKHNLNGSHYAGHFVNHGSAYTGNGSSAVYAETHKTDTNGPGELVALHAKGRMTYTINNSGYATAGLFQTTDNPNGRPIVCLQEYTANTYTHQIEFRKNNGSSNVTVGSIKSNNSATQYNTSSDYRLKENVVSLTGAIDRLKQLQPKRFNFIGEEEIIDGFIAHEVSSTAPYAVSGEKDAMKTELVMNEDGKEQFDENGEIVSREVIDPQSVDYSKLSTLTIAALQEALAKIETLEAKVAALEGS